MRIDEDLVIQAIVAADAGGPAKAEGSRLVEYYLGRLEEFPDTTVPTLAVEVPWYLQLGPKLYAVGQVDRILDDSVRTMCEWKTKGAGKRKKDGEPYKGSTEADWLEEIGSGPQLSIYAMAGRDGTFLIDGKLVELRSPQPTVIVRACIKSNPPEIWPVRPERGVFEVPGARTDAAIAALIAMGHCIRAARRSGSIPWAIPGFQCENKYRRVCGHLPQCKEQIYPPSIIPDPSTWSPDDPGYQIAKFLGWDVQDPDLVLLTQSGYQKYIECPEKWRREWGALRGEKDFELQVGTCYHAGLAAVYEQLRKGR